MSNNNQTKAVSQRGGGAKTEAGKAIVSKNALKHGLLSKEVLLDGEDSTILDQLRASLISEYQPVGSLETFLVERLLADIWRIKRALAVERCSGELAREQVKNEIFAIDRYESEFGHEQAIKSAPITDENNDKILRYLTSIDRSFYRTLHELQRVQAARKDGIAPNSAAIDVIVEQQGKEDD